MEQLEQLEDALQQARARIKKLETVLMMVASVSTEVLEAEDDAETQGVDER